MSVSITGTYFRAVQYEVRKDTGRVDLDQVRDLARREKPRLLWAGGTAIPRTIDFAGFAAIAREVGAVFVADIAHIAGLVAGGAHPSPVPVADVVTTGPITIPMMIKSGISAVRAGGVESAASAGGAFLPPVMGAVAFLMVEFTGLSYLEVVVASIAPALLYYLGVFALVQTLTLGDGPNELAIDEHRRWLYVANTAESSISIVDLDVTRPSYLSELATLGLDTPTREQTGD